MTQKRNIESYSKSKRTKFKILIYKSKRKSFVILLFLFYNKNKDSISFNFNDRPIANIRFQNSKIRFINNRAFYNFIDESRIKSLDEKIDVSNLLKISGGEQQKEDDSKKPKLSESLKIKARKIKRARKAAQAKNKRELKIPKIFKKIFHISLNAFGYVIENPFLRAFFSPSEPDANAVKSNRQSHEILGTQPSSSSIYADAFGSSQISSRPQSIPKFLQAEEDGICEPKANQVPSIEDHNADEIPTLAIEMNEQMKGMSKKIESKPTKVTYLEKFRLTYQYEEAKEILKKQYPDLVLDSGERLTGKFAAGHVYHGPGYGIAHKDFDYTTQLANDLGRCSVLEHIMYNTQGLPSPKHVRAFQNEIKKMMNHPDRKITKNVTFYDVNGTKQVTVYHVVDENGRFFAAAFDDVDKTLVTAQQRRAADQDRIQDNHELGSRRYNR